MAAYRQSGRLPKMEMLLLIPKLWSWKKAATKTMAIGQRKADNDELC